MQASLKTMKCGKSHTLTDLRNRQSQYEGASRDNKTLRLEVSSLLIRLFNEVKCSELSILPRESNETIWVYAGLAGRATTKLR